MRRVPCCCETTAAQFVSKNALLLFLSNPSGVRCHHMGIEITACAKIESPWPRFLGQKKCAEQNFWLFLFFSLENSFFERKMESESFDPNSFSREEELTSNLASFVAILSWLELTSPPPTPLPPSPHPTRENFGRNWWNSKTKGNEQKENQNYFCFLGQKNQATHRYASAFGCNRT